MTEINAESFSYPIYINIGKFVVKFEQNCHTIESGIRCILALEGLENEKIQEILLAGLEAEQLRILFLSLCYEYLKPDAETAKIIDYVLNTFRELISIRNDLIHGKWFLALTNEGKPIALGQKLHKNKKGSATKIFNQDINFFERLVVQAIESLKNVSKLRNCIAGNYPIIKNFTKVNKNKYEPIKSLCIK